MSKVIFQITIDDLMEAKRLVNPDVRLNNWLWEDLILFARTRLEDQAPIILESVVIDFLNEEVQ